MGAADPISAFYAPMAEPVDAIGSNPIVREGVWVQVPLGAPDIKIHCLIFIKKIVIMYM